MEAKLKKIIKTLKNSSGQEYFESIVLSLSQAIESDYVFVARINKKNNSSETIALAAKGKIAENITYDLKYTPCEEASKGYICSYTQDIVKHYPKDQLLVDMNIESYVGTPLFDSKNNVIGIVVSLSESKIDNESFVRTLFELFAGRIASEMEKDALELANIQYQERLKDLINEKSKELDDSAEFLETIFNPNKSIV